MKDAPTSNWMTVDGSRFAHIVHYGFDVTCAECGLQFRGKMNVVTPPGSLTITGLMQLGIRTTQEMTLQCGHPLNGADGDMNIWTLLPDGLHAIGVIVQPADQATMLYTGTASIDGETVVNVTATDSTPSERIITDAWGEALSVYAGWSQMFTEHEVHHTPSTMQFNAGILGIVTDDITPVRDKLEVPGQELIHVTDLPMPHPPGVMGMVSDLGFDPELMWVLVDYQSLNAQLQALTARFNLRTSRSGLELKLALETDTLWSSPISIREMTETSIVGGFHPLIGFNSMLVTVRHNLTLKRLALTNIKMNEGVRTVRVGQDGHVITVVDAGGARELNLGGMTATTRAETVEWVQGHGYLWVTDRAPD